MELVRRQNLEFRPLRSNRTGEAFSSSAVLFKESPDFFVHVEKIEPGRRASSPHFHRSTDEMVFVLVGEVTVVEGTESLTAFVGDAVRLAADSRLGHFVRNDGEATAEVLVISKRLPEPDVVMTPEPAG